MDTQDAVAMGRAVSSILRMERQLAHVAAELEGVKEEIYTIGIRLQGTEVSYEEGDDDA